VPSRSLIPIGLGLGLGLGLWAAPAAAGDPLAGKHYTIDVFQGPILAPSDVIGIAGAYAGVAEGIAGMAVNAAAPAVRDAYNVTTFSWDFSPSISFPFNIFGTRDDFDDSGTAGHAFTDFIYFTAGGLLQYGPFGLGLSAEIQSYSIASTGSKGISTGVTLGRYHALFAYRLLGDQLMIGGGARITTLSLSPHDQETNLTMIGAAPELGFLVRPDWQSFRIGATLRFPVHGGRLLGGSATRAGGLYLPDDVVLPLEVELGAALQIGPRPLNPKWIDPELQEAALHRSFERARRERQSRHDAELAAIGDPLARAARREALAKEEAARVEQDRRDEDRIRRGLEDERRARAWNWPREHVLVTAELLVTGSVANAVGLQGFLGQNQPDEAASGTTVIGSSGASVNLSPRFGVETEPLPGRLHARAGTYYEPSRLGHPVGRQHFTFGSDVRLFSTTWFGLVSKVTYKAQAYADVSPRYQSVSLGIGVWH
jgi:hypothetical protein